MKFQSLALALLLSLGSPAAFAGTVDPALAAAVASPDRPAADVARDADRKPAEMLAFAGVKSGMTVLDVNAGGGYFEEILSRAVGTTGKVLAHNGPLYTPFAAKDMEKRGYGTRLPNVVSMGAESESVSLPAGSVDVAIMVQSYHDYYFHPKERPGDVDVAPVLASLKAALKKGGTLLVVDHVAVAGSPVSTGDTLHRIDPALVRQAVEAAGFKFAGESDLLRNPADTHQDNVFKEGLRGHTDQFIYKFTK